MNNNIESIYQNALLSDAAYINLNEGEFVKDHVIQERAWGEFKKRGFTREQFDEFVDRYHVDFHESDKTSGFSATVFIDTDNQDKKTIAFRGTEFGDGNYDLGDLFQDLQVMSGTTSLFDFIGDMLRPDDLIQYLEDNNYPRTAEAINLINPFDTLSQLQDLQEFMVAAELVDDNGHPLIPDYKVNITGHSLGGHLALQATDDYNDIVDHTMTFNGAGLALSDRWLFQNGQVQPSQVDNFYATAGWEVTAGQGLEELSLFGRQGTRQGLFIESQVMSF